MKTLIITTSIFGYPVSDYYKYLGKEFVGNGYKVVYVFDGLPKKMPSLYLNFEYHAWDAFRTQKLFAPRPIPSVLYLFRKYYGKKRAIQTLINTIPRSIIPYKYKANHKLNALGYILFLFVWPLILFQALKSWKLSLDKLKKGQLA